METVSTSCTMQTKKNTERSEFKNAGSTCATVLYKLGKIARRTYLELQKCGKRNITQKCSRIYMKKVTTSCTMQNKQKIQLYSRIPLHFLLIPDMFSILVPGWFRICFLFLSNCLGPGPRPESSSQLSRLFVSL